MGGDGGSGVVIIKLANFISMPGAPDRTPRPTGKPDKKPRPTKPPTATPTPRPTKEPTVTTPTASPTRRVTKPPTKGGRIRRAAAATTDEMGDQQLGQGQGPAIIRRHDAAWEQPPIPPPEFFPGSLAPPPSRPPFGIGAGAAYLLLTGGAGVLLFATFFGVLYRRSHAHVSVLPQHCAQGHVVC
jgi:hypothetical protein